MTNEPKELETVLAEWESFKYHELALPIGVVTEQANKQIKDFLTHSIRSTEARMTERFREAVEAERGRFIGIYERRNERKRQIGMKQDSSFESFDFNVFANCMLSALTTEEERNI